MKNTQKNHKRARTSYTPVLAALGLVCILAFVFFVSGGIGVYSGPAPEAGEIDRTVQMLTAMEQQPPADQASFQHADEPEDGGEEPEEPEEMTAGDLSELEEELLTRTGTSWY